MEQYDYSNPLMWLDYIPGLLRGQMAGKEWGETARGAELTGTEPGSQQELLAEILLDPTDLMLGGIGGIASLAGLGSRGARATKAASRIPMGEFGERLLRELPHQTEVAYGISPSALGRGAGREELLGAAGELSTPEMYELVLSGMSPEDARRMIPMLRRESGDFEGLSAEGLESLREILPGMNPADARGAWAAALESEQMGDKIFRDLRRNRTLELIDEGMPSGEAVARADQELATHFGGMPEGQQGFGFPNLGQLEMIERDRLMKLQAGIAEEVGTGHRPAGGRGTGIQYISPYAPSGLSPRPAQALKNLGVEPKIYNTQNWSGVREGALKFYENRTRPLTSKRDAVTQGLPGSSVQREERYAAMWASIYDSDVTLYFGSTSSQEAKQARNLAYIEGKTLIENPTPEFWAGWVNRHRPDRVNVMGSSQGVGPEGTKNIKLTVDDVKAIHASGGGTFTKKTPRAYEGDVVTLNNSSIQYKVDHVKDVADGHKEHHLVKIDIDTPTTSTSVTPDGYSPLSNFADLGEFAFDNKVYRTAEGAYQANKTGNYVENTAFHTGIGSKAKKAGKPLVVNKSQSEGLMQQILEAKHEQFPEFREALATAGHLTHDVRGAGHWAEAMPRLLDDLRVKIGIPVPEHPIPHFKANIEEVLAAGLDMQRNKAHGIAPGIMDIPENVAARDVNVLTGGKLQQTTETGERLKGMDIGRRTLDPVSELGAGASGLSLGEWRLIQKPGGGYAFTQVPRHSRGTSPDLRAYRNAKAELEAGGKTQKEVQKEITDEFILPGELEMVLGGRPVTGEDYLGYGTGTQMGVMKDDSVRAAAVTISGGEVEGIKLIEPVTIDNLDTTFRRIQRGINDGATPDKIVNDLRVLDDALKSNEINAAQYVNELEHLVKNADVKFGEDLKTALAKMHEGAPKLGDVATKTDIPMPAYRRTPPGHAEVVPHYADTEDFRRMEQTGSWIGDPEMMDLLTPGEQAALREFRERLQEKSDFLFWTGEGANRRLGGSAVRVVDEAGVSELRKLRQDLTRSGKSHGFSKKTAKMGDLEMKEWVELRSGLYDHITARLGEMESKSVVRSLPSETPGSRHIETVTGSGLELLGHVQRIKAKAKKFGKAYPARLNEHEQRILSSYMGVGPDVIGDAAKSAPRAAERVAQWDAVPNWAQEMPGMPIKHVSWEINSKTALEGASRQMGRLLEHSTTRTLLTDPAAGLDLQAFKDTLKYMNLQDLDQLARGARDLAPHSPVGELVLAKVDAQIAETSTVARAWHGVSVKPVKLGEVGFSITGPKNSRQLIVRSVPANTDKIADLPMGLKADDLQAHMIMTEAERNGATRILISDHANFSEGLIKSLKEQYGVEVSSRVVRSSPRQLAIGPNIEDVSPILGIASEVKAAGTNAEKIGILFEKLAESGPDSMSSRVLADAIASTEHGSQMGPWSKSLKEGLRKLFFIGNEAHNTRQMKSGQIAFPRTRAATAQDDVNEAVLRQFLDDPQLKQRIAPSPQEDVIFPSGMPESSMAKASQRADEPESLWRKDRREGRVQGRHAMVGELTEATRLPAEEPRLPWGRRSTKQQKMGSLEQQVAGEEAQTIEDLLTAGAAETRSPGDIFTSADWSGAVPPLQEVAQRHGAMGGVQEVMRDIPENIAAAEARIEKLAEELLAPDARFAKIQGQIRAILRKSDGPATPDKVIAAMDEVRKKAKKGDDLFDKFYDEKIKKWSKDQGALVERQMGLPTGEMESERLLAIAEKMEKHGSVDPEGLRNLIERGQFTEQELASLESLVDQVKSRKRSIEGGAVFEPVPPSDIDAWGIRTDQSLIDTLFEKPIGQRLGYRSKPDYAQELAETARQRLMQELPGGAPHQYPRTAEFWKRLKEDLLPTTAEPVGFHGPDVRLPLAEQHAKRHRLGRLTRTEQEALPMPAQRMITDESELADWFVEMKKSVEEAAPWKKAAPEGQRDHALLWDRITNHAKLVAEGAEDVQRLDKLKGAFKSNIAKWLDKEEQQALLAFLDFLTNQHGKISVQEIKLTKKSRQAALKQGAGLAGLLMTFGLVTQNEAVNQGV